MNAMHSSIEKFLSTNKSAILDNDAQGQIIGGSFNNDYIWPDCVSGAQIDNCIDTINSNKWNKKQIAAFIESETGLTCQISKSGKNRIYTVVE